jgi:WD40 repeat protein
MRDTGLIVVCAAALAAGLAAAAERADGYGEPLPAGAVARLGTTRMRYAIADLCYTLDGSQALVIAGGELHVWDLARGERLASHRIADTSLRSLALSRDGHKALLADGSGAVLEWDLRAGKIAHRFATDRASLRSACYSPDEQRVLTLDLATATVEQWERATGKRLIAIEVPEPTPNLCIYGPGGSSALVARRPAGHTVYHYDLATGKLLKKFATNYCVYDMALSADGERLLTGQRSRATEWRLADYKALRRFTGHHGHAVPSVAYGRDDRHVLTGSRDGSARLWDRTSGKLVRRWFPHQRYATKLRVSPDGQWLLSYGGDRLIAQTSLATGEPRLRWERHLGAVHAVAFTPDGSQVVTGSADRTIRVWSVGGWQPVRRFPNPGGEVHGLAISPDGAQVAAASKDGTIRVLMLATGELEHTLTGHRGAVRAVAWAGGRVASAAGDGTVRLLDVAAEKPLRVLGGHQGGVLALAVAPDGCRALSGGRDGTVREWDLGTGRSLHSALAHRGWVETVAYSPDGRRALSAGRDGLIIEWALPDWRSTRVLDHKAWVRAARYVGHGTRVCSAAGLLLLWDRRSREPLERRSGHAGTIRALAASPDGRWLVTGSDDTTALVWDLAGE